MADVSREVLLYNSSESSENHFNHHQRGLTRKSDENETVSYYFDAHLSADQLWSTDRITNTH
jgi:hypothetical protein